MKKLLTKVLNALGNFFDPPSDYRYYNNYPLVDWERAPNYGEVPTLRPTEALKLPRSPKPPKAFKPAEPKGFIAHKVNRDDSFDPLIPSTYEGGSCGSNCCCGSSD